MEGKYMRSNPTTTLPHSRETVSYSAEAKPKCFMLHDDPKVKLIIRDRITASVGGKYVLPKKRTLDTAFGTKSGFELNDSIFDMKWNILKKHEESNNDILLYGRYDRIFKMFFSDHLEEPFLKDFKVRNDILKPALTSFSNLEANKLEVFKQLENTEAAIVNLSIGPPIDFLIEYSESIPPEYEFENQTPIYAVKKAVELGKIVVLAAGNESILSGTGALGEKYISFYQSLNDTPDIKGKVILVGEGSSSHRRKISNCSTMAGAGANLFVILPRLTDQAGTSFTAPQFAAAISLLKKKHPKLSPDQLINCIYASCERPRHIDDEAKKTLQMSSSLSIKDIHQLKPKHVYGHGWPNFIEADRLASHIQTLEPLKTFETSSIKTILRSSKIDPFYASALYSKSYIDKLSNKALLSQFFRVRPETISFLKALTNKKKLSILYNIWMRVYLYSKTLPAPTDDEKSAIKNLTLTKKMIEEKLS